MNVKWFQIFYLVPCCAIESKIAVRYTSTCERFQQVVSSRIRDQDNEVISTGMVTGIATDDLSWLQSLGLYKEV